MLHIKQRSIELKILFLGGGVGELKEYIQGVSRNQYSAHQCKPKCYCKHVI